MDKDTIKEIIAAIRPLDIDGTAAVAVPAGYEVKSTFPYLLDMPFDSGHVLVASLSSLVEYVNRHQSLATIVLASEQTGNITAILDWHSQSVSGAARHIATLPLQETPCWKAWKGIDRKPMAQTAFAEFIEEHLEDVASPVAAELLEVVTTLSGKKNVEWKQAVRLQNGAVGVQWEETIAAKAGESGNLIVPAEIAIEIPVYDGCEEATTYRIRCLLRYRIDAGRLSFELRMLGIESIHRIAFDSVFAALTELCKANAIAVPIYKGHVNKTPIQAAL